MSDLTGFDITHTTDQMGPIGYRRVMTGDGQSIGNMTKTVDSMAHNDGEKVVDTYVWQAKNDSENSQIYDIDIIYGDETQPPIGYQKCEKTLTPQLPADAQSFLCFCSIQENDVDALRHRNKETVVDQQEEEEKKNGDVLEEKKILSYGKIFDIETLGLVAAIVSTPTSMYSSSLVQTFVQPFVQKVFQRLTSLSDDELNSLDVSFFFEYSGVGIVEI